MITYYLNAKDICFRYGHEDTITSIDSLTRERAIPKKGLRRAKHNTTAACLHGKVEQVYIKIKCGHSKLLDKIMCWTQ
jgi:hypothetical protein